MTFCGLGTSNSKTSSFHVGESSKAPFVLEKKNEFQKGYETTCTYGLRHVSDNQVPLTHDQATHEHTTFDPKEHRRSANRQSAQRCREKKQKYMTDLEEKEMRIKANVKTLTNKIEAMRQRNEQLQLEKQMFEEMMFNLALKTKIRKASIERANLEIEKIMELRNHGAARKVEEPDLTLSLALPGIKAK